MMTEKILKPLGDFIGIMVGCDFVGISDEGEVFVSFETEDLELQRAMIHKIKDEFGDQIGKITVVVQTCIEDLQALVDGLNQALEEQEAQSKPNLLDIGEF